MKRAPRLYLASASPRRRDLLQVLGLPFTSVPSTVDEAALQRAFGGPAPQLAEYLARAKAVAALSALDGAIDEPTCVLAADTTVILDDMVLGKPRDQQEAAVMLRALRGRSHLVVTGVALGYSAGHAATAETLADRLTEPVSVRSDSVHTHVALREFTDRELAEYVSSGDPLDKAGAYGAQSASFHPVAHVAGCYLAVVGLPVCLVAHMLHMPSGGTAVRTAATHCPWSSRCCPPLPALSE